jgi:phenylacetate-CoA ligase
MTMNNALSRAALVLHERLTGRGILKRLEELNRTQWLSSDELRAMQQARLLRLVEYAYQFVPYYRRTFEAADFRPEDLRKDLACFSRLPILTKDIIRANFQDLLTTEPQRLQQLSQLSTSGSTGQPLVFMQDSDFRDSVTADIQRHISWAGWKLGDLQAFIWGGRIKPPLRKRLRARMIDWVWNRVMLNAFLMNEKDMLAFAKRLRRLHPRILFGYVSSVNHFAEFIRQSPYSDITFDGIFTTSECLLPSVRKFIEETFRCKVYNRYSSLDVGGVACECAEHNGFHVSAENNFVEILHAGGSPALPGEVGEIIVTNMNNLGMPFIRYSLGDAGAWSDGERCPCGRASPRISTIEGRLVDSFLTRDGRRVWSGAPFICLAHPSIRQFQVVQKTLDQLVVRLVQNDEIPQSQLNEILQAIRYTFGNNVEVEFSFMNEIPPLPSGKHSYIISELNRNQHE